MKKLLLSIMLLLTFSLTACSQTYYIEEDDDRYEEREDRYEDDDEEYEDD